jgi:hypothetical protein
MWWDSCRWELWAVMGYEIIQLLISHVPLALSCNKEPMQEIKLHDISQKLLVFNEVNTLRTDCKMKLKGTSIRSPYLAVNTPPVPLVSLLARYAFVALTAK